MKGRSAIGGAPPPLPEVVTVRLCGWPLWERRGKVGDWGSRADGQCDFVAEIVGVDSPLPARPVRLPIIATAGRGVGGEGLPEEKPDAQRQLTRTPPTSQRATP